MRCPAGHVGPSPLPACRPETPWPCLLPHTGCWCLPSPVGDLRLRHLRCSPGALGCAAGSGRGHCTQSGSRKLKPAQDKPKAKGPCFAGPGTLGVCFTALPLPVHPSTCFQALPIPSTPWSALPRHSPRPKHPQCQPPRQPPLSAAQAPEPPGASFHLCQPRSGGSSPSATEV